MPLTMRPLATTKSISAYHPMIRPLLFASLMLGSQLSSAVTCPDPLASMGGESWRRVSDIQWHSAGQNFEPAQTFHPGSEGQHVSDDHLDGHWQPHLASGELNWQVTTYYPFAGNWTYQEILGEVSRLDGSDGFRPATELTPNRRYTRWINTLQRFPALLFLDGKYVQGDNVCNLIVTHPTGQWRMWLNPATGLPRRAVHLEQDPLYGEVEASTIYEEWQNIDGLSVPARSEQVVNNRSIRRERLDQVKLTVGEEVLTPSAKARALMAGFDVPDWAKQRAHWFQRRIAAGAPMDTDPAGKVAFVEITPDVYQITGGTHHSLVIVGRVSLVVVDAPWGPRRSDAVIKALAERWPKKPISHLIITHHHEDHSAGLMRYVDSGVTLVMGVATRQYFGTVFAKSGRKNVPNKTVADDFRLNALGELVELYRVPNSHAEGMLVVYSRRNKTLFTADLFSPGRQTQHPVWSKELLNTIDWLNLEVKYLVGGHGQGAVSLVELRRSVAGQD